MKLHELRSYLESRLFGQEHLSSKIVAPLSSFYAGLQPKEQPAGVFLSLGPTGSGKTYTPSVLAQALHGNESFVLRVDCAEFQHSHEIAKLVGSPPGYLGHRETHPQLSGEALQAIRSESCPLAIVVFDEIEKASDSLWRLLLGILDKATLTLGDNRKVMFQNTLIFMTSNLGIEELKSNGFAFDNEVTKGTGEKASLAACSRHFSPEFMNRIDTILYYQTLDRAAIRRIVEILAYNLNTQIKAAHKTDQLPVILTDEAIDWLIKEGFSEKYGAREMGRVFAKHVKHVMAEHIIYAPDKFAWSPMRVTVAPGGKFLDIHPMIATDENYLVDLLTASIKAVKAGGA